MRQPEHTTPGAGHNNPPANPLLDRLKEDHVADLAAIDAIAEKANASPATIETDDAKAAAMDIAAEAAKLWKANDETRKKEKQPYKEGADTVDGFWRDPLARLDRIDRALMARVTAYDNAQLAKARAAQRAAEAEARRKAEEARKEAEQAAQSGRLEDALASLEDAAEAEAKAPIEAPKAADVTRVTTASGVTASAQTEWTFEVTDRAAIDLNALRDFIAPEDVDAALKRFVKINKGTRAVAGVRFFETAVTRRRRG